MSAPRWLKGNGGTEFLQFACARITRSASPLGGHHYRVTRNGDRLGAALYSGNAYDEAFAAATKANPDFKAASPSAGTPKVLDIIRTAAADCGVQGNTMAQHELLDAAGMTKGMLTALETAMVYTDRRKAHGKEMPTLGQWREFEKLARAAIAKATGSTS